MDQIDRVEGRCLFGADPAAYDQVRPAYPAWIFAELVTSGALFAGAATLEIGAGSGLATRPLLAHGADPIILIEPDARFAASLAAICRETAASCTVIRETFEAADLEPGAFDLIVAATSFHWLEPGAAFARARSLLKPGGTLALMWHVFGVPGMTDPFHDATTDLLAPLAPSPSGAPDTVPFALDRAARDAEARAAGFESVTYRESQGTMVLDPDGVGRLYGTFSSIQRLPAAERNALLDRLRAIAAERFGGRVTRNLTSCLYRIR